VIVPPLLVFQRVGPFFVGFSGLNPVLLVGVISPASGGAFNFLQPEQLSFLFLTTCLDIPRAQLSFSFFRCGTFGVGFPFFVVLFEFLFFAGGAALGPSYYFSP